MTAARVEGTSVILEVTVQARAARTEVSGLHGDTIRVRLAAPPLDGRANAALLEYLAAQFGVPRTRIALLKGRKSRRKTLRIEAPTTLPQWLATTDIASITAGSRPGNHARRPQ